MFSGTVIVPKCPTVAVAVLILTFAFMLKPEYFTERILSLANNKTEIIPIIGSVYDQLILEDIFFLHLLAFLLLK